MTDSRELVLRAESRIQELAKELELLQSRRKETELARETLARGLATLAEAQAQIQESREDFQRATDDLRRVTVGVEGQVERALEAKLSGMDELLAHSATRVEETAGRISELLQASANAARRSLLDASQLLATTMSAVTDNSQVFVELQRGHADRKNAAMLASLGLIESTTRKAAGDASAASLRISHDLGPVVAKLEETSAIIAQRATEVIGALAVLRKEEGQVSLRSIQNELARIRRRSTTGAVVVSVVLLILSAAVFSLLMRDSAFRQAAPVVRSR